MQQLQLQLKPGHHNNTIIISFLTALPETLKPMEKCGDTQVSGKDEEMKAPVLSLSIEEVVEQSIGRMNWMQIFQIILVSTTTFLDSQQCLISVFADALPSWHCTSTSPSSCRSNKSDLCSLSRTDWAWDYNHTSIISEWGLECASSFVAGLPTTCFFVGCLIGGLLLPPLGDSKLGRKNLLTLCSLIMCIAAFASAFSPDLWVYSVLRFISGIGRGPIAVCGVVLLTERIAKKWRNLALMFTFSALCFAPLSLTGIAYFTRRLSWRILYLSSSIPGLVLTVLYYFFMYESPRWLFTQGRSKEALMVLNKLRRSNSQVGIPNNVVCPQQKTPSTNTGLLESFKILASKRWVVKRLLAAIVPAFGIGMADFGLLLAVQNLGYNMYFTTILNGVLSFIASLLTCFWWIPYCSRKSSLLGFSTLGGVTCVILAVLSNHKSNMVAVVLMQFVSLFCAYMGCNIVLVYVVELFPTCVRNSASSVVRLSLMLGPVFVPTLILVGRANKLYSYGVFGIVLFVSGFLVLCLPETKGKVMCDTMEEQESKDNNGSTRV